MPEISREEAIALVETRWWETLSDRDIVAFQLFTPLLCMPFDKFHKAVESALKRPVFTHEFASSFVDDLKKEFLGEKPAPTFEEILNLIPEEKRIVVITK
jgi:hypothetical protein